MPWHAAATSEVEAMEAELESDKSGPVCIVNRYRHSKRQRMMEKQLDAESPTCSPASHENEQNHQHTSFAAGSHEFQESPTPIPQWAVKEGMNQKTSPPALVLAAIGFWHHLPVLERAVMADTSKESTETSPPASHWRPRVSWR